MNISRPYSPVSVTKHFKWSLKVFACPLCSQWACGISPSHSLADWVIPSDFLQMCTSLRFLMARGLWHFCSCAALILLTNMIFFSPSSPFVACACMRAWHASGCCGKLQICPLIPHPPALCCPMMLLLLLKCNPLTPNLQWTADISPFLLACSCSQGDSDTVSYRTRTVMCHVWVKQAFSELNCVPDMQRVCLLPL